jgi:hypothetical protein
LLFCVQLCCRHNEQKVWFYNLFFLGNETKAKTHRSCFRKVFTPLVDVQEIEEKNSQQLIEDYFDIFNACLSKYLLIY